MTSIITTADTNTLDTIGNTPNLRNAVMLLTNGLTDTSKRQYDHTYNLWVSWCHANGLAPHDLRGINVLTFLNTSDISRSTKQARLTHLRKLAQTLNAADTTNPHFDSCYKELQLLKLAKDDTHGTTREKQALKPAQVHRAFNVWSQDSNAHARNRALLALLFYAGLRRSEAVKVKWSDIDFERGTISIHGGKGRVADDTDVIPFAGWENARGYLEVWRDRQPDGYEHVVTRLNNRSGFYADDTISTEHVRRICAKSGDFKPHDARRTLITEMLNSGVSLPDVQFIARHKMPQTTLGYAKFRNASDVKGRVKVSY